MPLNNKIIKSIKGLENLPYLGWLRRLNALTLTKRRIYADMLFVFKYLHNLTGYKLSDVGLSITKSNTHGNDIRFEQRMKSGTRLSHRIPLIWNQLSLIVVSSKKISVFKSNLFKHLLSN